MEITKSAVEQFKKILGKSELKKPGIRVSISKSGCCGTSIGFDISEKGEDGGRMVKKENIVFYFPEDAYETLAQATIDYSDSKTGGFTISNVAVSSCCG